MQKRWTGNNVDLNLLSERIEGFFKDKGFITKRTQSEGEFIVSLAQQHTENVKGVMTAKIIGGSNDFTIEFTASELTRRSILLGMLTKAFGGGYLVLRGLRLQEALEKLEKEFWVYIENEATDLAGSAGPRSK